jgi:hypothetical protein
MRISVWVGQSAMRLMQELPGITLDQRIPAGVFL